MAEGSATYLVFDMRKMDERDSNEGTSVRAPSSYSALIGALRDSRRDTGDGILQTAPANAQFMVINPNGLPAPYVRFFRYA